MEFKVGDIVEWCGLKGVISSIEKGLLIVYFEKLCWSFLPDGRYLTEHIEPSLKLIERPKQKVKKYKVLFIDGITKDHEMRTYHHYSSESEFKDKYPFDCKFIKLLEETMIEVEE